MLFLIFCFTNGQIFLKSGTIMPTKLADHSLEGGEYIQKVDEFYFQNVDEFYF